MPIAVIGSWIVIGLLIGLIASRIAKSSDGPAVGIVACAIGAAVFGAVYTLYARLGVKEFVPRTLIYAVVGGCVTALLWNVLRARFGTHEAYTPRRSY